MEDERYAQHPEDDADDLLRRALIDPEQSVAVALKVNGLALADALTVVFHGRTDLGTIQTYVAHGPRGAGSAISAGEMLRVPVDLDLGDADSRDEAEEAYVEQARTLRDALVAKGWVIDHDLRYMEAEGGQHNEQSWGARVADVLKFLYPARKSQE